MTDITAEAAIAAIKEMTNTDNTLARLRAVQAASRDTYARSVAADAADEIERLRKALDHWRHEVGKLHSQVDRLRAEIAEAKTAIDAAVKAERERCVRIAKMGWITADYNTVGVADADKAMALCEHIVDAILGGDNGG